MREWKTAEMYTQGEIRIFSELPFLRSAFANLPQNHLKASNHLLLHLVSRFWRVSYSSGFSLPLNPVLSGAKPTPKATLTSCSFLSVFFVVRLSLLGLKSSLVYIISWTPTQSSWSHLSCTLYTWTHLLSIIPPIQLTRHFHSGNACVLFTLGKRYISYYATCATYVKFLLGYLRPVYFRKQVHILLRDPRYSRGISKESSVKYLAAAAIQRFKEQREIY